MFMSTLASVSLVLMPETTACIPMILRFVISEDFKQRIIDRSTTRVLSFLNIVGLWAASATLACRPVQGQELPQIPVTATIARSIFLAALTPGRWCSRLQFAP